jgi:hypothetical protein
MKKWFPIEIEDYIQLVRCRTRVIWLGKVFDLDNLVGIFRATRTQTRSRHMQSRKE